MTTAAHSTSIIYHFGLSEVWLLVAHVVTGLALGGAVFALAVLGWRL